MVKLFSSSPPVILTPAASSLCHSEGEKRLKNLAQAKLSEGSPLPEIASSFMLLAMTGKRPSPSPQSSPFKGEERKIGNKREGVAMIPGVSLRTKCGNLIALRANSVRGRI